MNHLIIFGEIINIIALIFCMSLNRTFAENDMELSKPYEFGFNIEGQQHRHEKKDEKGIIMGEFGFLTADGVYHVTVYATDENGNFKILSTKNIRSDSKTNSTSGNTPENYLSKQNESQNKKSAQPSRSCSSCSIPSTESESKSMLKQQSNAFKQQDNNNFATNSAGNIRNPSNTSSKQTKENYADTSDSKSVTSNKNTPMKPILTSAQMKVVDKNTNIDKLNPGEKKGLPKGITEDFMSRVLYTFNYTVGFHGHHEDGYENGAKKGYYYITGRNGVKTRVDYVADENGFRPTITEEILDVLSDEVPKPETEKEDKYGLKHYEFKWFY